MRTDHGELAADLVVDASGRRSPLDRWLAQIGAQPTAGWWAECGVAYFSRHYRLRRAAELPGPATTRVVQLLEEFTVILCGADNRAMQLVVAPLAADRRFRALKDPAVFTALVRTMPAYAAWLEAMDPSARRVRPRHPSRSCAPRPRWTRPRSARTGGSWG